MKTNYLQAMGVVAWRLRKAASPQQSVCYHLLDTHGRCWGILAAKMATKPEDELFQAILSALNMKAEQGAWTAVPRCIFLGAECSVDYPTQDIFRVITHSLAEMLQNPLLKAKVWQDFQEFFRHYHQ